MRTSTGLLAAGSLLALTLGTAACGSTSGSPRSELSAGFSSLAAGNALTAKLTVSPSPGTLALLEANAPSAQDKMMAGLVLGSDLTLSERTPNGQPLDTYAKSGKPADTQFTVDVQGSPTLTLRVVDNTLYAQAAVQRILQLAHQSPDRIAQLEKQIPSNLAFVHAALAGQWVSLSLAQVEQLASQVPGGSLPSQQQTQTLIDRLQGAFLHDVSVSRSGSTSDGDHLVLTGNVRKIGTDLLQAVESAVPAAGSLLSKADPSKLPDRSVTIDAYVKDNVLTKVSLNLTQFFDAKIKAQVHGQPVPLVIAFSQSALTVSAPARSTPIDLLALIRAFSQSGAGSGGPIGTSSLVSPAA